MSFAVGVVGLLVGGALAYAYATKPSKDTFKSYLKDSVEKDVKRRWADAARSGGLLGKLAKLGGSLQATAESKVVSTVLSKAVFFEDGVFSIVARVPVTDENAMMFVGVLGQWFLVNGNALQAELDRAAKELDEKSS